MSKRLKDEKGKQAKKYEFNFKYRFKPNENQFIYGNYDRYYGYRYSIVKDNIFMQNTHSVFNYKYL